MTSQGSSPLSLPQSENLPNSSGNSLPPTLKVTPSDCASQDAQSMQFSCGSGNSLSSSGASENSNAPPPAAQPERESLPRRPRPNPEVYKGTQKVIPNGSYSVPIVQPAVAPNVPLPAELPPSQPSVATVQQPQSTGWEVDMDTQDSLVSEVPSNEPEIIDVDMESSESSPAPSFETGSFPSVPSVPDVPSVPSVPTTPSASSAPVIPNDSSVPSAPSTPSSPPAPSAPVVPSISSAMAAVMAIFEKADAAKAESKLSKSLAHEYLAEINSLARVAFGLGPATSVFAPSSSAPPPKPPSSSSSTPAPCPTPSQESSSTEQSSFASVAASPGTKRPRPATRQRAVQKDIPLEKLQSFMKTLTPATQTLGDWRVVYVGNFFPPKNTPNRSLIQLLEKSFSFPSYNVLNVCPIGGGIHELLIENASLPQLQQCLLNSPLKLCIGYNPRTPLAGQSAELALSLFHKRIDKILERMRAVHQNLHMRRLVEFFELFKVSETNCPVLPPMQLSAFEAAYALENSRSSGSGQF